MISRINYYLKNYKDNFEAENEKGEMIMNKRLVLKLIKDIIKQYAYVKDFKREENIITIILQPYSHYEDTL